MSFRRVETKLDGVILVEPEPHGDDRGFLVETFQRQVFAGLGIDTDFVQENQSRSSGEVLRGIHAQRGQSKLVRCSRGRIWDVVVDLRADSPGLGDWEGHELDDVSHRQLYIPDGFGHGYCVLSDEADVTYLLSAYYDPAQELSVAWDDPELGIDWPLENPRVSERDRDAPGMRDALA